MGLPRSNGCAYADSPASRADAADAQRVAAARPRRPLHRGPDRRRGARALRRRRQVLVDRHAALQLPVHRPALLPDRVGAARRPGQGRRPTRPRPPTSGGRWRPSAARRRTCSAAPSTAARPNPGRSRPVSHGCPTGGLPRRPRAQHPRGGRPMSAPTPQELVERALALSRADDCVVLVEASAHANLRWAANTLTTNGDTRSVDVTVISFLGASGGSAAGVGVAAGPRHGGAGARLRGGGAGGRAGRGRRAAARGRRLGRLRGAAGDHVGGGLRRVRARPGRADARGGGRRHRAGSASPSTRSTRSTWPRRPACGCATPSRRPASSSRPRATSAPARPGSGAARDVRRRVDLRGHGRRPADRGWAGRPGGSSWPPGGTTRSCRRARSPT